MIDILSPSGRHLDSGNVYAKINSNFMSNWYPSDCAHVVDRSRCIPMLSMKQIRIEIMIKSQNFQLDPPPTAGINKAKNTLTKRNSSTYSECERIKMCWKWMCILVKMDAAQHILA